MKKRKTVVETYLVIVNQKYYWFGLNRKKALQFAEKHNAQIEFLTY